MDFLLHPKQPGSTPQTLRSHIFFTNLHFRNLRRKQAENHTPACCTGSLTQSGQNRPTQRLAVPDWMCGALEHDRHAGRR